MRSALITAFMFAFLGLFQTGANAQEQLKIGMAAPGFDVWKWTKGKPITKFEKGRYYIVEFTSIGCPPCRKAIPHLTRIAKKYADKVIVISIYDGLMDTGTPEYMGMYNALITEYGNNMQYIVAVDKPGKVTSNLWLTYGVPAVYLVDTNGNIAWHGHPDSLDTLMAYVAKGPVKQAVQRVNGELIAVGKIENMAKDLVQAGKYMEGVAKIDSIVASTNDPFLKRSMYYLKFELFAGKDDQRAYDWLRWLLAPENKEMMREFDWDHFIGSVQGLPKFKDYDLQIATIDRCIELAEFKCLAADHINTKAKIYLKRSKERTTSAEAAKDTAKAIELYKQAIAYSKKSGNDLYTIAVFYAYIANLEKTPALIRKNREESLKTFREALEFYNASKAPVKKQSYTDSIKEEIAKLEKQLN